MNIREKISEMVFDIIGQSEERIPLKSINLREQYMFDSIRIIQLIVNIEEYYSIEFDLDYLDLEKIFDVECLVAFVEKVLISE